MSFQTRKSFVRLRNTIKNILDENREACDCPIDCQVSNTTLIWTQTAACIQRILSKMALRWRRGDELLNKIVVLFSLRRKKCSRRFIKFRLNHWWQMDYFDDVFHTFLGLDSVNCLAVNGTVTSLPVFIQNILNCVPKMNEAYRFMGVSD